MKQKYLLSSTYYGSCNAEFHVHLDIFCFGKMSLLVTNKCFKSGTFFINADAELTIEKRTHSGSWIDNVEILMFWFLSGLVSEESNYKTGKLVFLMGLSATEMLDKKKTKQPQTSKLKLI